MGFDGLFFGRADFQDIAKRRAEKTMEMIWKASANLDRQSWLFTGILPNGYGPPGGFCFDFACSDPPIMVENTIAREFSVCILKTYRIIHICMITMFPIEFKLSFKQLIMKCETKQKTNQNTYAHVFLFLGYKLCN